MVPLITVLAKVPDFRKSKGKRHPLAAILGLACAAALGGARSLTAISQWGREHNQTVLAHLGFSHFPGPCVATLHRTFSRLDVQALEKALTEWLQMVLGVKGGLALDGKTLRGSRTESGDVVQLLAAFAQVVGVVLAEQAISGRDELEAALALLQGLDLHGWIVTGDARLTNKALAQQVIDHHGDYVLVVKDNQPTLREDIVTLFTEPRVVAETITTAQTITLHGQRIEVRTLQASSALVDYCDWPGLQQVFRRERHVTHKKTGTATHEVEFGITSLPPTQAHAQRIAALARGHWSIENRLHWVRDVDFDEDRSRVRTGQAPQVMAAIRNAALALLRLAGYPCIATGLRHFALHSTEAIQLVTNPPLVAAQ
jgi:predicted transposase YbfD/YdcC